MSHYFLAKFQIHVQSESDTLPLPNLQFVLLPHQIHCSVMKLPHSIVIVALLPTCHIILKLLESGYKLLLLSHGAIGKNSQVNSYFQTSTKLKGWKWEMKNEEEVLQDVWDSGNHK